MSYYAISDNKLKHSIAVGRYMQKYANERLLNPELGREWFLLGYLHDIGEEFTHKKEEHNKLRCWLKSIFYISTGKFRTAHFQV